ncbi:MAG: serine hydrolase, partial [Bacteroidia bacterium]
MTRLLRSLVLTFLFCLPFCVSAQVSSPYAGKAVHLEVAERLKKEYNAKNYKVVYGMLDKDFQKHISEKELADFFNFNLADIYGSLLDLKFDNYHEPSYIFLAAFEKGKLDLTLICNPDGKISGMQWLPHKAPELVPKLNKSYLSDNPKKTWWDLKVDSIVANFMLNADNCGLSIAVLNNNEASYYNYGVTKRGTSQVPSKSTIYEIGSVSKTFTGILLAKAVSDKKVNLTDDIRKYLPGEFSNLRYKDHYIQLQHLANHTSRIPRVPLDIEQQPSYDPSNPYKNYNKDMVYAYLRRISIDTIPGTKSEYSNLGMALLGIILENVYNKSYETLVKEFVTQPLKMEHTGIKLSDEELKQFATGYDANGNEATHWDLGDLAAA